MKKDGKMGGKKDGMKMGGGKAKETGFSAGVGKGQHGFGKGKSKGMMASPAPGDGY